MYIPKHFELPAELWPQYLARIEAGNLITVGSREPVATYVPIHFRDLAISATVSGENSAPASVSGKLITHISRVNDQWRTVAEIAEQKTQSDKPCRALFVADFVDGYIDPTWSPEFADQPRVPTWNYVTIHIYGRLSVHQDRDWLRAAVQELSERHGFDYGQVPMAEKLLAAIIGLELEIDEVQAKAKLSQNHRPAELAGEIAGLRQRGALALAEVMAEISCPYANNRWETIDSLRQN